MTAERWRPTLAGLRNVWEYDEQLFELAGGRMILRGPNGSGKSNALALLVPLLLDGGLGASRMDPFAGSRSMRSLLLCPDADDGGSRRFRHESRRGYAWLRFERDAERLTVGVGAQATSQRDGVTAWYFVTTRSVGNDLDLVGAGGVLSAGQLRAALGDDGVVLDSAEAYRDELDKRLFGLGADRYRRLISLLLTLRRPKLADKLHLDTLTDALSAGLPPLDDTLIDEVAATFDDLERTRDDLERARRALGDVDAFLPTYRAAVRSEACARAVASVSARNRLRQARADRTRAERALEAACVTLAELAVDLERLTTERGRTEAAHQVLLRSDAYRDLQALEDRRRLARERRAEATKAARRLGATREALAHRVSAAEAAADRLGRADRLASAAFDQAAAAADDAGVPWPGPRAVPQRPRPERPRRAGDPGPERPSRAGDPGPEWPSRAGDPGPGDELERAVRPLLTARRQDIDAVRAALDAVGRLESVAEARAGDAEGAAERRRKAEQAAADRVVQLEGAVEALADALTSWATAAEVQAPLLHACAPPNGPSPREVGAGLLEPRRAEAHQRRAAAQARSATLLEERGAAKAQRATVQAAAVLPPERTPTRTAARDDRPGAPLWACCTTHPSLSDDEAAGIEAALEGAGLLDAWIGPDGLERAAVLDAFVVPEGPAPDGGLLGVLVPDVPQGCGLTPDEVEAVLAGLPNADLRTDGSFHLGSLEGQWSKPAAEHLGATAREGRRQRRLAQLDVRLAELTAALAGATADAARAGDDLGRLDALLASLPSRAPVERATQDAAVAEGTASARQGEHRQAVDRAGAARRRADDGRAALARLAAERRVSADGDALDALAAACASLDAALREAVASLGQADGARREARTADQEQEMATIAADEAADEHRVADQAAGVEEAAIAELDRSLAATKEEVLRRQAELEAARARIGSDVDRLHDARLSATSAQAMAAAAADAASGRVIGLDDEAVSARARCEVLAQPAVFASLDLDPALADPTQRDGLVAAAAELDGEQVVGSAADLERRFPDLLTRFDSRYQLRLDRLDGVLTVWAVTEQGAADLFELRQGLAASVERQEHLLEEGDRRAFEQYLAGEVAEGLRDRLHDADRFVSDVGRALKDAPTSSGLRVHLSWELAGDDPDLERAVKLLRTDTDLHAPDDTEHLRRFFLGRIRRRRAEEPGESHATVLAKVLDYRQWHHFAIATSRPGQRHQRLTRTEFARMSGGEQATVLHLPLFAAAAATYESASIAGGPRLVALDEAFAGIDEEMRGKLGKLLVGFDLDFVLTGHELWGTWADVPDVAVYDLLREPSAPGVSAVRLRWVGGELAPG